MNENFSKLLTLALKARDKFSTRELNKFKKTLEVAVTLEGKKAVTMYFAKAHPEVTKVLKAHKQRLGLKRSIGAPQIFVLAHGKIPCLICKKERIIFPGGNRPTRLKPALCSAKCRSMYAVTCIEKTMKKTYGVKNFFASKEFEDNKKSYFQRKYGEAVTAPLLVPGASESYRATSMKNWGVDHTLKSEVIREKQHNTHKKKYGKHFLASSKSRERLKTTSQERWGVDHPSQSTDVKERKKIKRSELTRKDLKRIKAKTQATCLARYGVTSPSQSTEVFGKSKRFERKILIWRGKEVVYQGFEEIVLKALEVNKNIKQVSTNANAIGGVPYKCRGKNHVYHPDIHAMKKTGEEYIIEVKSTFTIGLGLRKIAEKNKKKFLAADAYYKAKGIKFVVVLVHKNKIYLMPKPYTHLITMARRLIK